MYGQTFRNEPSQFLGEIPSDCFESKDATGRRALPEPTGFLNPKLQKAVDAAKGRLAGQFTTGAQLKKVQEGGDDAGEDFPDDDDFIEDSLGRIRRRPTKEAPVAAAVLAGDPYVPGEAVIHAVFGQGIVQGLRGPQGNRAITIAFAEPVGTKELQLAFAAGKLSRR
jgi:hypothetical protein